LKNFWGGWLRKKDEEKEKQEAKVDDQEWITDSEME